MAKFDMAAAWEDSVTLLKSHSALTGTVAAAFLFLPALVVAWFGPVPVEPAEGAGLPQIVEAMQQSMRATLPYQLGAALLAMIGTLAILRLWLARSGTSVGESLGFAAALFPTMIIVQLLTGLMMGFAALLLVVPALYLVGRLSVAVPLLADRGIRNPIEPIRQSWALTHGNGWAIFFFLFLVAVVIFIVAMILIGVTGAVAGSEPGVGRMVAGVVEAGVGAVGSLVSIAVSAAVYRQLAVRGAGDAFA
ncbi:MAG: hypothetical protein U0S50_06280 [Sphingopyxis sp.]|uniref:hypothetical protein n=1 Tax=Sphingopyxis sp. TaxID=1908224 RepID=UPI002ABAE938|nr:hypothetical protein [Sphingopyxis sp.]MDZ3831408.1 hypothetical protein [Sphingopyxis sp.]